MLLALACVSFVPNKITMSYFCLKPLATSFTSSVCRGNTVLLTVASDRWGSRTPEVVFVTLAWTSVHWIFSNATCSLQRNYIYIWFSEDKYIDSWWNISFMVHLSIILRRKKLYAICLVYFYWNIWKHFYSSFHKMNYIKVNKLEKS